MSTSTWYHLKRKYALFPGVSEPVSATFLTAHYERLSRRRTRARRCVDRITGAGFRVWAGWRARQVAKRLTLGEAWVTRAAAIARRRFVDPNDIALFDIASASQCDEYMRRYEYAAVNKVFNPAYWRRGCALSDKILFAARCEAANLPHPAMIARRDGFSAAFLTDEIPADVILKPIGGNGGRGVRWLKPPREARRDRAAFGAWLKADAAPTGQWMAQDRMAPHPDLLPLSDSALLTARVTTIINEDGAPEIVTSVLRVPFRTDAVVDNRGLITPIDPETGALGAAKHIGGANDLSLRWRNHPVHGVQIEGVRLPGWDGVAPLVTRAHRDAFSDYTMVGWDVGFSDKGLVLIEGNGKPCINLAQRGPEQGAGAGRLGALMRYQLELVEGARRLTR